MSRETGPGPEQIIAPNGADEGKAKEEKKRLLLSSIKEGDLLGVGWEQHLEGNDKNDPEVLQTANERIVATLRLLENYDPEWILEKVEKLHRLLPATVDWRKDSACLEAIKGAFLYKFEYPYAELSIIKRMKELFGVSEIINDESLIEAAAKKYFSSGTPLKVKVDFFTEWGVPVDKLKDNSLNTIQFLLDADVVKVFKAGNLHKLCFLLLEYAQTWPEILENKEIREKFIERIKGTVIKNFSVGEFPELVDELEEVAKLFELPREIVVNLQKNILKSLIVNDHIDSSNRADKLDDFYKLRESFGLSDADFEEVQRFVLNYFLEKGLIINYNFFAHFFRIELDAELVKRSAEEGMRILLNESENNFFELCETQREIKLPTDFFSQPDIFNLLVQKFVTTFLSDSIDLLSVKGEADVFGPPQNFFEAMDEVMSYHNFAIAEVNNFVANRGVRGEAFIFPRTLEAVKEQMLKNAKMDGETAMSFLNNFALFELGEERIKEILVGIVNNFPWMTGHLLKFVEQNRRKLNWSDRPWLSSFIRQLKEREVSRDIENFRQRGGKDFIMEKDKQYAEWEIVRGKMETNPWLLDSLKRALAGEKMDYLVFDQTTKKKKKLFSRKVEEVTTDLKVELSPEGKEALENIGKMIDSEYNKFLRSFLVNSEIPQVDKDALTGKLKEVKMNNLLPNVRAFVARYLIQELGGKKVSDFNKVICSTEGVIGSVLERGFRNYENVFTWDIPLYDILYEEFDELRSAGRRPTEVYLGRDGIFAYIGRRAQDAIRRSKANKAVKEGAVEKKEGEVEISPKYLVFPSTFRDFLKYDVKREFLEQERVSLDADPIFYDTGYEGSIPEHIMRIMGFPKDEIEKRIKLLSAKSSGRRSRRIGSNKDSAVANIEQHPQAEHKAENLFKDPVTGKIMPLSFPAGPEAQFYFSMIKQAIARHYIVRESLRFEPVKNMALDFETRKALVNKDFASVLPQELLSDPATFLKKHGRKLEKEGKMAEEDMTEIFFLTLSDGTEVVAKKFLGFPLAKDAQGEFCLLNSAKKEGLKTAEPIAFLMGKEEGDEQYILMRRVSGLTAAEFYKYINTPGRFTSGEVEKLKNTLGSDNRAVAELFRKVLKVDKTWRLEDLIINFDQTAGRLEGVVPIDWSEIYNFDQGNQRKIAHDLESVEEGPQK